MTEMLLIVITLVVAYANGANDNFKGVATLFGSHALSFRHSLTYANIATFAGSLTAFFLSEKLLKIFSGKGIVPDALLNNPHFLIAVAFGAGITVLFACMMGIPVSTTHALTGGLAGSGLAVVRGNPGFEKLYDMFLLPLIVSPLIAMSLTVVVYFIFKKVQNISGLQNLTCLCVGSESFSVKPRHSPQHTASEAIELTLPNIVIGSDQECHETKSAAFTKTLLKFNIDTILSHLHFLSAGAVCFSRGLNDTPKIAALLMSSKFLGVNPIPLIAIAMVMGGLLQSRKIAHTLSQKITEMDLRQGFLANLITALIVIMASLQGLPVSTTHVSCGSLFGIGLMNGQAKWAMISRIVSAWIITLPLSAGISALYFLTLNI